VVGSPVSLFMYSLSFEILPAAMKRSAAVSPDSTTRPYRSIGASGSVGVVSRYEIRDRRVRYVSMPAARIILYASSSRTGDTSFITRPKWSP